VEQGESKTALVKVALCEKCVKKLMWKREKEKGMDFQAITGDTGHVNEDPLAKRRKKKSRDEIHETSSSFHPESRRRRRNSRSRSPPRRPHISD
jgi:protein FRA10AC1